MRQEIWPDEPHSYQKAIDAIFNNKIQIPEESSDSVGEYLILHPQITDNLDQISQILRQNLGQEPEISLEVYEDPEIEDEYLVFYIKDKNQNPELLGKIDKMFEEIYPLIENSSGWVLLTPDFREEF